MSLWCQWSRCIPLLAPGAKLRKSSSWHVEANALHRRVVAKLHGKHYLARSLEIRLIVTQKPQGGRKKNQCRASEYRCTAWLDSRKVSLKRKHQATGTEIFAPCSWLLGVGFSVEVMNVPVPATTGATEQDGEKGCDWHEQILIKFSTISLLFSHNVDCIWAALAGTKRVKISTAVSDSTTWNCVFFFWKNFCLQSTGQKGSSYVLLEEVKDAARPGSLWKHRAVLCLALVEGITVEMSLHLLFSMVPCCTALQETDIISSGSWCSPCGPPNTLSPSCPMQGGVRGHSARLPRQTFTTELQKTGRRISRLFLPLLAVASRQFWTDKLLRGIMFSQAEEKTYVDFSATLTSSCVSRVKGFRCVQLQCPELSYRL